MSDYVQLNLDELTKAVSKIDGGCTSCICSFLNDIDFNVAENIVSKMNEASCSYGIIVLVDGEWECNYDYL